MAKISGGVPGGWHGGLLPGASSPFRFQFDAEGCAEVDGDIAAYLTSMPGPFALDVDNTVQTEPISQDEDTDTKDEPAEDPKPKRIAPRRKKSLDE